VIKEIVVSDPLLDGIESLLTVLLTEAKASVREITDDDGKVIKTPAVSFEERLKLVATCTKFLESKVKIIPPPPEKPSDFEEMLNGNHGTAVSTENPGQKTGKKRGRPRLPESQFDPSNGRTGGPVIQPDSGSFSGSHSLAANGSIAAPFWGDAGDDVGNPGNA
jgi:hypothetical protein